MACHFVFQTPPELFFGVIILYAFRTFERMMGSRKFAVGHQRMHAVHSVTIARP